METSPEISALAEALAKAQGQIEGAKKDSANPHFKSKYADLASVWDACRDALTKNGLSVVQAPGPCAQNQLEMTTMLLHASGQWIKETLSIPLQKVDAQGYGSATTYARRYSLAAMVGVAPDDDDGNAASQPKGVSNAAPAFITAAQTKELQKLVSDTGTDASIFCDYYKIEAIPELPGHLFTKAKAQLQSKLPKQKEAA